MTTRTTFSLVFMIMVASVVSRNTPSPLTDTIATNNNHDDTMVGTTRTVVMTSVPVQRVARKVQAYNTASSGPSDRGYLEMVGTLWQVKTYHEGDQIDEFVDVYDAYPELVALKIHHGGKFTKFPGRRYERGKIHIVDLVDPDKFSVLELEEMMKEIGYKSPRPTYYHFVVPGKDLDYGLHALGSDRDVIEMLKFVDGCKVFEIYTEHWVSRVNTYDRSPGVSKVVIEQLPDEVPDEVPPE
ncbi:hypothetical protein OSB04_027114 [Centaurea solstitialis]|uniref:PB1-like domain-containing protein n=1 Tax=Centaurea solstitialis TaxID=347529 RepID=A0AA38SY65_9ASTR|nr:hypothetical protein OSB04_027114 [Centaurea solstitialis]